MLKNRFIYLLLVIYGSLFIILYNEYQTLLLYLVICAMPIASGFILVLMKRKINIDFKAVSNFGDSRRPVHFVISLINHSRLFALTNAKMDVMLKNTFSGETKKDHILFSVNVNSTEKLELRWKGFYSGLILLTVSKISLYDYFGIFKVRLYRKKKKIFLEALKLPNYIPLLKYDENIYEESRLENETYSLHMAGEDPNEIFDLHDYKEGDRLNRIHWKLSSKRSTYVVKDYSQPISSNASIVVDFSSTQDLDTIEALFKALYNISYQLILSEESHEIIWFHKDFMKVVISDIQNREDLFNCFHDLYLNGCSPVEKHLLSEYVGRYPNNQVSQLIYLSVGTMQRDTLVELEEVKATVVSALCIAKQEDINQHNLYSKKITLTMMNEAKLESELPVWYETYMLAR